jgi:hypothetical protein
MAPFQAGRKALGLDYPSSRGLTHFMAAALPEIPTCALKLGDKTSATGVTRGLTAGFTRVRSFRVRGLGFID